MPRKIPSVLFIGDCFCVGVGSLPKFTVDVFEISLNGEPFVICGGACVKLKALVRLVFSFPCEATGICEGGAVEFS